MGAFCSCFVVVLVSLFVFVLNSFRRGYITENASSSGNVTILDFATLPEQAAAKRIIPSSLICDFVLPVLK